VVTAGHYRSLLAQQLARSPHESNLLREDVISVLLQFHKSFSFFFFLRCQSKRKKDFPKQNGNQFFGEHLSISLGAIVQQSIIFRAKGNTAAQSRGYI
jgi:hypothetical protein